MNDTRLHLVLCRHRTLVASALAVIVLGGGVTQPSAQQGDARKGPRLNKIIEQLEQGQAAVNGEHWRFIDQEHSPYVIDKLEATLGDLKKETDASGRPKLTPVVRIPQEADEDFRWVIKQVLDTGFYGVVVPHLETKADAIRAVRAMRYPPQRYTKQREPVGQRGYGPGRAARYWGLELPDYLKRADVWPLNPDGELFLIGLIETGLAVDNIKDILSTPGLGAVLLAPGDLSMSLGVGPHMGRNPPEVEAAYQRVLKACLEQRSVTCGCSDAGSNIPNRIKEGFKLVMPLGEGPAYAPARR
jgi:4-hydroxy-2-oxoheptanedioate aldolase